MSAQTKENNIALLKIFLMTLSYYKIQHGKITLNAPPEYPALATESLNLSGLQDF